VPPARRRSGLWRRPWSNPATRQITCDGPRPPRLYSRVVRELYLPKIRWKLRRYTLDTLMTSLVLLIPDPDRRDEIRRMLLAETGLDEADGEVERR
jgi:hypothetical protein